MVPISNPITPAPTITIFFGTFFNSRAPVEESILFSSISIFFITEGFDPVAMIIFLADNVSIFFALFSLTLWR